MILLPAFVVGRYAWLCYILLNPSFNDNTDMKRAEFMNLSNKDAHRLHFLFQNLLSLQGMPELVWYNISATWGVAVYRTR